MDQINKIIIDKEVLRLDDYFNKLNLQNKSCQSCGTKITINNFGLIKKSIGVFCNKLMCMIEYKDICNGLD